MIDEELDLWREDYARECIFELPADMLGLGPLLVRP